MLTKRRDFINKRKEIRIKYLINAWSILDEASNRKGSEFNKKVEKAISDIQLFGTKKQIELAQKFADEIASHNKGETINLLKELRKDLRKELKLEPVPDKFKFLRF